LLAHRFYQTPAKTCVWIDAAVCASFFAKTGRGRDQEKEVPVFLKSRATSKEARTATELWCFRMK